MFLPGESGWLIAGYAAVGKGYKGVVNDVTVAGIKTGDMSVPPNNDLALQGRELDVVVIRGGAIGAAIARELTRWDLSIALLEKEEDLAKHASGRDSGMIHPDLAPPLGSKKATSEATKCIPG
ncbi:FAD-dependent oxidoreductase [Dehalococcoidia bacterium]|nr:FAD-dependent oxidoreductase [Dehalococcoidia bacterium]